MNTLLKHRHLFLFIWYLLLFYFLVAPISLLVQNIYFYFDPAALAAFEQLYSSGANDAQLLVATAIPSALINLVIYTLAAVPMFALLHDELDQSFALGWKNKKQFTFQVIRGYLLMLAFSFIASLAMMLLGLTDSSANQQSVESLISLVPFLTTITVVILAPFVEEIVFRYLLIKGLKKYLPLWGAGVISVLVFATIHVLQAGDFINIIPYLALGAGLTIAYLRTNNIMVSIALHFIQNLIAVLISLSIL
ncbi:MAG: lysostaphin resistance A-like protein [Culicoidibacterales bacterium]